MYNVYVYVFIYLSADMCFVLPGLISAIYIVVLLYLIVVPLEVILCCIC